MHDTSKSGDTVVEYGLVAALVSVAAIVTLMAVGAPLTTMFTSIIGQLDLMTLRAS